MVRTQEFTLQWSAEPGGPFSEIVRQQWSFGLKARQVKSKIIRSI